MLSDRVSVCSFTDKEYVILECGLRCLSLLASEHENFLLNDQLYYSERHRKAKKTDSSVVLCSDGRRGVIQRALRFVHVGTEQHIFWHCCCFIVL